MSPPKRELYIAPHRDQHPPIYRHIWSAVRRLLNCVGREHLPAFAQAAISVTEQAGRISLQSDPSPIPVEECGEYKVLSANLWHDWPRFTDLTKRLEAFARLVESEQVDLVLLQEVARTPTLQVDEWLADRLNMAYVYARANGSQKIGFEEGLAIYSRFPLKRLPYIRQMSQAHNPFSRRLALGVEVDTPCGEILAFSTHLGLARKQNARQLHDLHDWINGLSAGRSAIIGGDFNAPEHTRQIRHARSRWIDTFREIHRHGRASTHEIRWPWGAVFLYHRLDYIFLQAGQPGWQVMDVRHMDAPGGPHSDHRAVLAQLSPLHRASS